MGNPLGLTGLVIDGQFRLDEPVGEGGFSVVYRGMHLSLREPIAIKCMKIHNLEQRLVESFTQRFFDESRIAYRLSQGNIDIVRSIMTGVITSPHDGSIVPYMILDWLEGSPLSLDLRVRRERGDAPRTIMEVGYLFDSAARAIAYAHSQGVAHRDVKPANLFLHCTHDGTVRMKVLDFGLAKIMNAQLSGIDNVATIGDVVVVSPQYAAPEQVDPKLGLVSAATDVYSFAIVLLEALANRRMRQSPSIGEILIEMMDPRKLPTPRTFGVETTDKMDALFRAALAPRPQHRPPDLGTFWSMFTEAVE